MFLIQVLCTIWALRLRYRREAIHLFYKLNQNSQAISKSSTKQDDYYFFEDDYDLDIYEVTFGDLVGETLMYPTARIKSNVELARTVSEQKEQLQEVKQVQADLLLAIAMGGV